MTPIMQAKKILLLCSGKENSEILYRSLYGDIDPKIPASVLQLHTNVTVLLLQITMHYVSLIKKDC